MAAERDSLLRQADHMWKMLDNMAENDPDSYQRFIKKQMQEGSAHVKPPEPVFCLRCEIDEATSTNALLYINVCQWCQVPKPKTDNDPIPVKGGTLRKLDPTTQVYDIAFNPNVMVECSTQDLGEQLIQLILDYSTDMTKLQLKRSSCKKLDKKFIGSIQDIISSIDECHQHNDTSNITTDHPQSLLDQLAHINQDAKEPDIIMPDKLTTDTRPHKKLIEEIPTEDNCTQQKLKYHTSVDKGKLIVTIEVGSSAGSIAESELDVSEDELELQVPGIPDHLLVKLPCTVDKDTAVARYQPKMGQLCITMTCKH